MGDTDSRDAARDRAQRSTIVEDDYASSMPFYIPRAFTDSKWQEMGEDARNSDLRLQETEARGEQIDDRLKRGSVGEGERKALSDAARAVYDMKREQWADNDFTQGRAARRAGGLDQPGVSLQIGRQRAAARKSK